MDPEREFRVARRRLEGAVVVVPEGDVDLLTVNAVRRELDDALREARCVVVDLRGVTFMDSSGLRLLVEVTRACERDGFELAVVRGPAAVERLFTLSGLADRLRIVDDPAEVAGDAGDGAT